MLRLLSRALPQATRSRRLLSRNERRSLETVRSRGARIAGTANRSAAARRRARIARIALRRRARFALRIRVRSVHHNDFVRRISVNDSRAARDGRRDVVVVAGRAAENRNARTVASKTASSALATDQNRGS